MPPKRTATTSPDAEPAPKKAVANSSASTKPSSSSTKAAKSKPASKPSSTKVAKKTATSSTTTTNHPAAPAATPGDKQAWTRAELRYLFETLQPKRVGVNWADVAAGMPGRPRTVKSCQNKWARMQGKILAAVKDLGGE
ncbi:uncharacterized protein LOC62_06G008172 [Vanrija pseudolonga]|uniref:Myb-like domain-containing protein n=1 Tax=Vanrija pseudolonga TaxID=143232 RepID=A0AAF0YDD3_9TREE|nr:hypothetical protein LOC62_06G008172 [Vanrija pseudolonga]